MGLSSGQHLLVQQKGIPQQKLKWMLFTLTNADRITGDLYNHLHTWEGSKLSGAKVCASDTLSIFFLGPESKSASSKHQLITQTDFHPTHPPPQGWPGCDVSIHAAGTSNSLILSWNPQQQTYIHSGPLQTLLEKLGWQWQNGQSAFSSEFIFFSLARVRLPVHIKKTAK